MALLQTNLPGLPVRRGKVRDVYDLGERLLIVATDRISAFDWVMPNGVPDKGRILTAISAFWFARLDVPHHLISTDVNSTGLDLDDALREQLSGRVMLVTKAEVVPFECVVRGYLAGSGWAEYRQSGTVCGEPMPPGLTESARLKTPIFTPATKAEEGHDENVPFPAMAGALGQGLARSLRSISLDVYGDARSFAESRGLILADTKFEFGLDPEDGSILLVDEVLTPDSSRYWPADGYQPGRPQPSFDKQFVRDWLIASGWDRASPPPELPPEVIARTRDKYVRAFEILTGHASPWA